MSTFFLPIPPAPQPAWLPFWMRPDPNGKPTHGGHSSGHAPGRGHFGSAHGCHGGGHR